MSSDPIEVLRKQATRLDCIGAKSEAAAIRGAAHDLESALASLSAPKPESAEAVGEPIEDGAETEEDSPYLRLFVRPRNLPAGVEALRDLRDRVIPAALRHYASGPGYIEEAQEIVSRALVSLSAPKPESAEAVAWAVNGPMGETAHMGSDKPDLTEPGWSARPLIYGDTTPPRPEASKWERIIGKWQERVAAAGFNGVEEAIEAIEASIAPQQASAPVGVEAIIEAFDEITGLCRHLRQGGPAPEDLHDLSVALDEAIGIAGNMLAALTQQPSTESRCDHCGGFGDVTGEYPGVACPKCRGTGLAQQPAACDMGELCIGCEPRNPDGSCPDQQPAAVDEADKEGQA